MAAGVPGTDTAPDRLNCIISTLKDCLYLAAPSSSDADKENVQTIIEVINLLKFSLFSITRKWMDSCPTEHNGPTINTTLATTTEITP